MTHTPEKNDLTISPIGPLEISDNQEGYLNKDDIDQLWDNAIGSTLRERYHDFAKNIQKLIKK